MSNTRRTAMTSMHARKIQSVIDRKPNPAPQQALFKARTSSTAAKKKEPK